MILAFVASMSIHLNAKSILHKFLKRGNYSKNDENGLRHCISSWCHCLLFMAVNSNPEFHDSAAELSGLSRTYLCYFVFIFSPK